MMTANQSFSVHRMGLAGIDPEILTELRRCMVVRAAVLYEPNQPLQIEELDQESPKAGEVLVNTGAAGVCASRGQARAAITKPARRNLCGLIGLASSKLTGCNKTNALTVMLTSNQGG